MIPFAASFVNPNDKPSCLTLAGQRWAQHPTFGPDLDLPIFSSYEWSEKGESDPD